MAQHRTRQGLDHFWSSLKAKQINAVEAVVIDMWDLYVTSMLNRRLEAYRKIVFDKFHIAKHLSETLDQVWRRMNNNFLRTATIDAPVPATTGCDIQDLETEDRK